MDAISTAVHLHESLNKLGPVMRERVAEAEKIRQVPESTIADLKDAGLFRVFQPARFGGAELPMAEVLPLVIETAGYCPSSAWVMAVLQIHAWLMGLLPDAAQDEVYGTDPETLVCGVLQPRAMAKHADGGYILGEASWPYASGCDYAEWVHVGGLVPSENGAPEVCVFLLPRKDVEIIDDWHVTGLRGTGSKTLATAGCFVPAHRVFSFIEAIAGVTGKARPVLYQSAIVPMLCLNVTGPALGAARTALDVFVRHIEERNLPFSQHKQIDSQQTHRLLGEVMLQLDCADLLLQRASSAVHDNAREGRAMPVVERNAVRVYSSAAVRYCVAAIESLFLASGGAVLQESHPLQQLNRDAKAMAAHAALAHENNLELWGAACLDKPLNTPFV